MKLKVINGTDIMDAESGAMVAQVCKDIEDPKGANTSKELAIMLASAP